MTEDDDLDEFISVLQDVMLPSRVPVLPGLDVATHFSVPADTAEATGAWFDVAAIDGGRVALVVGQVPGGGLATTLAAHAVNAVLRASLRRDGDVSTAVELADLHARDSVDSRGTSVTVAIIDPATGDVVYVTAGHDAPVVTTSDGSARALARTGSGVLGYGGTHPAEHHTLDVGDLVVLGSTIAPSAVAGSRVQGDAGATASAVARAVSDAASDTSSDAAVTVVAAERRTSLDAPLVLDLAVDDTTGRRARIALQDWLDSLGAPAMDAMATVHAASELIANAVEHAADPDGDSAVVNIRAGLSASGHVVIDVIDHGSWAVPSDDPGRGRGLAMAAGLVDELAVTSDENGTCARLRHRLSRPVRIDREPSHPVRPPASPVQLTSGGPGSIRISGAFGPDDADRVGAELLLASRGGTRSVEVDLSEVTHLSADGLRMLGDLVAAAPGGVLQRSRVVLHAPDGSVAHAALERARIYDHGS